MVALLCTIHVPCSVPLTAAFNVSLELQGGNCADQLTLICRHDAVPVDPNWIHNGTAVSGQLVGTAFHVSGYSFRSSTEHRVTVMGVNDVTALDGYVFQCVYSIHGTLIKSNAVQYSFVPNGQSQYITTINYALHCCQQLFRVMVCLCATVTSINPCTT